MRKTLLFLSISIIISSFFMIGSDTFAAGADPIVPAECNEGTCGLSDLATVVANIINGLIIFSVSVASIMFAYAGFLYITAGGDTGQIKKATGIFKTVAIGFVIIIVAFFGVKELVKLIANPDTNLTNILGQ